MSQTIQNFKILYRLYLLKRTFIVYLDIAYKDKILSGNPTNIDHQNKNISILLTQSTKKLINLVC